MHIGVSPLARHGAPVFPVSGTFDGQQQCYHYAPVYDHDGITLIPADFPHDLRVCSTLVRHLPTRQTQAMAFGISTQLRCSS